MRTIENGVSAHPDAFGAAACISNTYVLAVEQAAVSTECVLLSTCLSVPKDMKSWLISDGGDPLKVELDVTDLGGHLDTTLRGRAGTLTEGGCRGTFGFTWN